MNLVHFVRECLLVTVVTMPLNGVAQRPGQLQNCAGDDYAVFSALLGHLYGSPKIEKVVLLDMTSDLPLCVLTTEKRRGNLRPFFDAVPKDVQNDFLARNKSPAKVEASKIQGPFLILPLSSKSAQELSRRRDGWWSFHEKYPTAPGIIALSLPGFNREHNRALLFLQMSCGPLCGGSSLFFLSKDSGQWKVDETATVSQT